MRIQVGKWSLAVGMEWVMPNSDSEVRAEKKARPRTDFVLTDHERQRWAGFHPATEAKTYAAALLIGLIKPDAVVMYPVSDDQVWVCAIQDGMPVVSYDRIVPYEEARNTAIGWTSLFVNAEMIGEVSGAQITVEGVLDLIDESLRAKTIKQKQLEKSRLRPNSSGARKIVGAVSALGVVGACGFGYYLYQQVILRQQSQQTSMAEATRQAMLDMQNKARAEAERNAKIAAFQQQVQAAREEYKARINPSGVWAAFTTMRRALPVSLHGYRPQTIECSTQQCRVMWNGMGAWVSPADKLRLPRVEHSLTSDRMATSVFPLVTIDETMPGMMANIGNAEELRFWLQSAYPRLNGYIVEQAQPVTVNPPAGLGLQPEVVAYVGKWQANFQGNAALIEAGSFMTSLPKWPVRLVSLKYVAGGGVNVNGEFVFVGG